MSKAIEAVKRRMQALNLNQSQLARRTENMVSQAYISGLLSGRYDLAKFHPDKLLSLLSALEWDTQTFLRETGVELPLSLTGDNRLKGLSLVDALQLNAVVEAVSDTGELVLRLEPNQTLTLERNPKPISARGIKAGTRICILLQNSNLLLATL